jgi:hypothetical protein
MALLTLVLVFSEIRIESFITLETVATETFAFLATSFIVAVISGPYASIYILF